MREGDLTFISAQLSQQKYNFWHEWASSAKDIFAAIHNTPIKQTGWRGWYLRSELKHVYLNSTGNGEFSVSVIEKVHFTVVTSKGCRTGLQMKWKCDFPFNQLYIWVGETLARIFLAFNRIRIFWSTYISLLREFKNWKLITGVFDERDFQRRSTLWRNLGFYVINQTFLDVRQLCMFQK